MEGRAEDRSIQGVVVMGIQARALKATERRIQPAREHDATGRSRPRDCSERYTPLADSAATPRGNLPRIGPGQRRPRSYIDLEWLMLNSATLQRVPIHTVAAYGSARWNGGAWRDVGRESLEKVIAVQGTTAMRELSLAVDSKGRAWNWSRRRWKAARPVPLRAEQAAS